MQITFEKAIEIIKNGGKVLVRNGNANFIVDENSFLKLTFVYGAEFYEYNE